jgi:hypothetical protein
MTGADQNPETNAALHVFGKELLFMPMGFSLAKACLLDWRNRVGMR